MKCYQFPQAGIPDVPRAVALGCFDGVHLGHRAVLWQLFIDTKCELSPAVFTFDDLPKWQGGRIYDRAENDRQLDLAGVAECFCADFGAICHLSPEEFVRDVLVGALHAKAVVCGYDYRFGAGGAGDADTLQALGRAYGLNVSVVPAVTADGEAVSSTRIRRLIALGDMQEASRLLGHPYTVRFEVTDGQHLGRTLGTPTINQHFPDNVTLPRCGVYVSAVTIDGHITYGVTNIGTHPTVGGTKPLAETWIPEFSGDLYGKAVPVSPLHFLREEAVFSSKEDLQKQIIQDAERAAQIMRVPTAPRAILFDFDDTLQNRWEAFWGFARVFADHHFPEKSEQEREDIATFMTTLNHGGYAGYPKYYHSVRRALGLPEEFSDEQFFKEQQYEFPRHTTLLPGVMQGLAQLRRRGWKIGIVTNGDWLTQNRKLDQSGIRPLVDVTVVSRRTLGEAHVSKPNAEIYRRAAAYLGVPCEDCIFVGDHPVNDIRGAMDAGMKAVFMLATGFFHSPENPDVPIVHDLQELIDLIGVAAKP